VPSHGWTEYGGTAGTQQITVRVARELEGIEKAIDGDPSIPRAGCQLRAIPGVFLDPGMARRLPVGLAYRSGFALNFAAVAMAALASAMSALREVLA
jgi:hypothetical protein